MMTANKPGVGVQVQDCIVVLEYYQPDGSFARRNFDFLCTDETNKNDYHFVLHVWVWLFLHLNLQRDFDQIEIWSDGGPHHFKTRYCQFMWHCLSLLRFGGKRITHNFFASYHGHSLADGHAASVKRCLLKRYLLTELERSTGQRTASFGPTNVTQVAEVISAECANTHVQIFSSIDRDNERKPQVKGIEHIKSYHSFVYQNGQCFAKERTNYAGIVGFNFN